MSFFDMRGKNKKRRGFTVVEMLIVIGIMGVLSGTLLGYTNTSGKRVLLYTEQGKVISALTKAKSYALRRYSENDENIPCAFGVRFSQPRGYELFQIFSGGNNSCDIDQMGDTIESFSLRNEVEFLTPFERVVFEAPYLYAPENGVIIIGMSDDRSTFAKIEVTAGGAISSR